MHPIYLVLVIALSVSVLLAGCSEDSGSPVGPPVNANTSHYEITVQISSIWAENNCENTPGNIGDFEYRLIVRTPDESGGLITVGDTGVQEMLLNDGDRTGATTGPIHFLVPNDPEARFAVEYLIGEYDPDPDFEIADRATHVFDRGGDQLWVAAAPYEEDQYTENKDGSGSGLYKFTEWNTRPEWDRNTISRSPPRHPQKEPFGPG